MSPDTISYDMNLLKAAIHGWSSTRLFGLIQMLRCLKHERRLSDKAPIGFVIVEGVWCRTNLPFARAAIADAASVRQRSTRATARQQARDILARDVATVFGAETAAAIRQRFPKISPSWT